MYASGEGSGDRVWALADQIFNVSKNSRAGPFLYKVAILLWKAVVVLLFQIKTKVNGL